MDQTKLDHKFQSELMREFGQQLDLDDYDRLMITGVSQEEGEMRVRAMSGGKERVFIRRRGKWSPSDNGQVVGKRVERKSTTSSKTPANERSKNTLKSSVGGSTADPATIFPQRESFENLTLALIENRRPRRVPYTDAPDPSASAHEIRTQDQTNTTMQSYTDRTTYDREWQAGIELGRKFPRIAAMMTGSISSSDSVVSQQNVAVPMPPSQILAMAQRIGEMPALRQIISMMRSDMLKYYPDGNVSFDRYEKFLESWCRSNIRLIKE